VLEELRLLSNLETGTEKILQIVLAGQPELELKLADPGLRQLRQRIALHVRLRPLSDDEIAAYVRTRLELAGAERLDVFAPAAILRVAMLTQGIPRIVNVLCDAALVTAFAMNARQVTPAIVDEAWTDYGRLVGGEPLLPPQSAQASLPRPAPEPVPERLAPAEASSTPIPEPLAAAPALAASEQVLLHRSDEPDETLDTPTRAWALAPRHASLAIVGAIALLATLHAMRTWNAPAEPGAPTPPVAEATMPGEPAPAPVVADAPDPGPPEPPSLPEARAVVHDFIIAYESLDAERVADLFASDAVDNGHTGVDAIRASYEQTFDRLSDVDCTVPRVETSLRGDRLALASPFIVAYRDKTGAAGALHGTAEWEIARREGAPRIVSLRYAFEDAPS